MSQQHNKHHEQQKAAPEGTLEKSKMPTEIENINPNVFKKSDTRETTATEEDDNEVDPIDNREVFGKFPDNFFLWKET